MFKAFLATFLALSLSACSYFTPDKVYQDPRGKITISQSTCKSKTILDTAPDDIKPDLKEALVEINEQPPAKACWVDGKVITTEASDQIFVVAENGGYAFFPKANFK